MEAVIKLARQSFLEVDPQSPRYRFIAREGSWHGSTTATLAIGEFKIRQYPFEPLLANNVSRVSACHPYRGMMDGETTEQYVTRLAQELEDEFHRFSLETVCGFIVEPIVGTVSPNPGFQTPTFH
jgi:adenosylmethionine-8-amino-7-oxononanoate aminotransferase